MKNFPIYLQAVNGNVQYKLCNPDNGLRADAACVSIVTTVDQLLYDDNYTESNAENFNRLYSKAIGRFAEVKSDERNYSTEDHYPLFDNTPEAAISEMVELTPKQKAKNAA